MRYKILVVMGIGIVLGCAPGMNSTVCVVDPPNAGYQCSTDRQPGYYINWEQGKDLICASSADAEEFLKSCKQHEILPITLCTYEASPPGFLCKAPGTGPGEGVVISLDQANNYFCLSPKDHRRLLERCAPNF